jgi:hypothetical protein
MKIISALVLGAVLFSTNLYAQSSPTHPTDTTAEYLGAFEVSITLGSPPEGGPTLDDYGRQTNSEDKIIMQGYFVWAVGSRIDYVADAASITVSGSGPNSVIDSLTNDSLFSLLSAQATRAGIVHGYSSCSIPSQPKTAYVYQPTCVSRNSSGNSTYFTVCPVPAFCNRTYETFCTAMNIPVTTCTATCDD